jgi:hypothetical protein
MAVSGSGSFENPFEGQQPSTPGAKKSAANEAVNKKNAQSDATFYGPSEEVAKEVIAGDKAKKSRNELYLAARQAEHIKHFQGRQAAREFLAEFRGVSPETIASARQFVTPPKREKLDQEALYLLKRKEAHIRATKGNLAAQEFAARNILGLSEETIQESRQFEVQKSKVQGLRETVFGGFSAFGLVQTALSSFSNSLKIATENLNAFVSTAITGESPGVTALTGFPRSALAAAPGVGIAAGAGIGAIAGVELGPGAVGTAIIGGAIGFGLGTLVQSAFDPLLQGLETLDSSIAAYTQQLVGISPEVTQVSVEQTIRRLERQFERSDVAGARLASISEARFRLEEAFFTRGTQLINSVGPYLEFVFNALASLLEISGKDVVNFFQEIPLLITQLIERIRLLGGGGA